MNVEVSTVTSSFLKILFLRCIFWILVSFNKCTLSIFVWFSDFCFSPPFGTPLLWIESAQTCFYNMFRVNTFYFQSYTYLKTLETGHRCYSTRQHTKAQTQPLFSGFKKIPLSLTFWLWTQSSCEHVDWLVMVSHPRDNGNVLSF